MSQLLVTAINGGTARFFTLESVILSGPDPSPRLVEHEGLTSSEGGLPGEALWSNVKPGRNRGVGGQAHGYDDHRQNHEAEFEKRFAQSTARNLLNLIQTHQVRKLILVAEPKILGLMRSVFIPLLPQQVTVYELARDLCHLKPQELHEYLAGKGQLPARKQA